MMMKKAAVSLKSTHVICRLRTDRADGENIAHYAARYTLKTRLISRQHPIRLCVLLSCALNKYDNYSMHSTVIM